MEKRRDKNRIARPAAYLACCSIVTAVWLTPFQYSWNCALLTVGFFGSLLWADLIRIPPVAWLGLTAASAGLCVYDPRYTACFAPFAFVYWMLRFTGRDERNRPVERDGWFFLGMLTLAAFVAAGFFAGFSMLWKQPDLPRVFHRQYVPLAGFIALFVYFAVRQTGRAKRRGAGTGYLQKKRRIVYAAAVFCFPAVFAFISACDTYIGLSTLPAFLVSVLPFFFDENVVPGR